MPSTKRMFRLLSAFATLLLLAGAVACHGFFVDPTLTSLAVGPTGQTIVEGHTLQMTATGTYDDSSTKNLTASALWTSDNATSCAAINGNTGLVTAVQVVTNSCTANITAQVGTVTSSSVAVNVTIGNITSIVVTPTNPSITAGNSQQFVATANGTAVVTNSVNWTLGNTTNTTGVSINTSGLLTTQSGSVTAQTTIQVIATDPSSNVSGQTNLVINPHP